MASFGRDSRSFPRPASILLKTALLACLLLLLVSAYKHGLFHLISTNSAAQFTYFGIAVLYFLGTSPCRAESILVVIGGVLLVWLPPLVRPSDFPGESIVRIGAFVGVAGLAAMCGRAIVSRNREAALGTLARSLIFVVLGIVLGTMLEAASAARPFKYDRFLYCVDLRFGAPVSFIVGRWFRAWLPFGHFEAVIYHSLPLALAALYGAHLRREKESPVDVLMLLALNATAGYALYFLYPASGPAYAFPQAFPAAPPVPGQLALEMVRLNAPPNAMPSLHMAGAVLIWWNSRFWRIGSIVAFAYMLLTALSALGFGEHYFLDLVVAFPFALAMQAAATSSRNRWPVLAAGVLLTGSWVLALLYQIKLMASIPVWLLWGLAFISVGLPLIINARFLRPSEESGAASPSIPFQELARESQY